MNNNDYNLYKVFLNLYEKKSVSKAAESLYVSQPSVSYSLKELENQLGYTLFYRNSRGIEPTNEAKELYSYISKAFNLIRDGEDHLKNLGSLTTGIVKIGAPSHISVFYLSKYISDFRILFPGIKFEVISKSTTDLVQLLESKKIDIIIDTNPINIKSDNTSKVPLTKLENCFAYNKEKFGELNKLSYKDLLKYPLILPSSTSSIRKVLDDFMESKGIQLLPVIETWTTEFLYEMVKRGVGIGYCIKNVIDNSYSKNELGIIELEDNLPSVDICGVYLNQYISLAAKKFVDFLIEGEK